MMLTFREQDGQIIVNGSDEELKEWTANLPMLVGESCEMKAERIKQQLIKAGIDHVDVIYDRETDKDSELDSFELKIAKIREQLRYAGITHVDLVYDYVNGEQKIRIHKMATALEFNIDESPIKIAHKLGWHRFE